MWQKWALRAWKATFHQPTETTFEWPEDTGSREDEDISGLPLAAQIAPAHSFPFIYVEASGIVLKC